MNVEMDATFTAALRETLVTQVERSRVSTRQRHWRRGGVGLLVLSIVGGGTAYAAGAFQGPPGSDQVQHVAPAVSMTGSGTQSINLGAPPAGANSIQVQLTCLTAGTFTFPDGASMSCTEQDLGAPSAVSSYTLPIDSGRHITITTSPGDRWLMTAGYGDTTTTAWGVNAHGQTYGVANNLGTPDLVAAIATNGQTGYVDATQLALAQGPMPASPEQALAQQQSRQPASIPVYEVDGTTVIGDFAIETATR